MIAKHKTRTVVFLVVGVGLQALGGALARAGMLGALLGWVVGVVGVCCFLLGCLFYAKAKGYPIWVGLLGLLSCVGLLILAVLPDRHAARG